MEPIDADELAPGSLNVSHGTRWQYAKFSFGGDAPDSAYGRAHARIFGEKPSPFCAACGKRHSWCECGAACVYCGARPATYWTEGPEFHEPLCAECAA